MKPHILISLALFLCGFSFQPSEERRAQDALPQGKDKLWSQMAECKTRMKHGGFYYAIDYTPEVKALDGKEVTLSGFMLPLEATEKFQHFLLSKRTPTCPFCMPGKPNEVVEVFSAKPMEWDDALITLTGTLHLVDDKEKSLFFRMTEAKKR